MDPIANGSLQEQQQQRRSRKMEALDTVRERKSRWSKRGSEVKTYRKVPADSRMSTEKLMCILGDAAWHWGASQPDSEKDVRGVLERLWLHLDGIAINTGGCKHWQNSHRPAFPFRRVCYSKTRESCTLEGGRRRLSRLQFEQGLRETLGLSMAWCHVGQLMAAINSTGATRGSRETISKPAFIAALWPYTSDKALAAVLTRPVHDGSVVTAVQRALTMADHDSGSTLDASTPAGDARPSRPQVSSIDEADL